MNNLKKKFIFRKPASKNFTLKWVDQHMFEYYFKLSINSFRKFNCII